MSSSLSPPPGGSRYDHLDSQIGSQRQIWRILFLPWETGHSLESKHYVVFPFWKSLTNCLFTSASGEEVVGWPLPKRKNQIVSWFSCNLEFLLDLMNNKFFKSDIVILGSSSYTSSALAPPVPRSSRYDLESSRSRSYRLIILKMCLFSPFLSTNLTGYCSNSLIKG